MDFELLFKNMDSNINLEFRNKTSRDIFSRRWYERITIILVGPFYIIFLIAIAFKWVFFTPDFIARIIILISAPLLLSSLYLTSYKKIIPQRIGDCLQIIIWILIISGGNTYWGGSLRIDGPLFFGNILLIPFYALLLDSFLVYFNAIISSGLLIINFLLRNPEISVLSISEILFKIITLLMIAFISSTLIKRILTERKITEELHGAYLDLQRLDKAKSEFVSIASHQLRTPLTAIKGYVSMLLEGSYGKVPEKAEKPLENVSQSNERLIKLVNDLLNVSKIEAGRLEMNYEKVDIGEIVKSVFEELKNEAVKKKLYLKWEEPKETLSKISVDKDKLRQVILNLVDNAIRYTEKGGITVRLQVTSYKLQVIISDTGEGMNEEELEKMFTSFSRGSAGTKLYTEGAGLGLYVAKKFVEMHNGKVWAKSAGKGKGSTFYIELPIK